MSSVGKQASWVPTAGGGIRQGGPEVHGRKEPASGGGLLAPQF